MQTRSKSRRTMAAGLPNAAGGASTSASASAAGASGSSSDAAPAAAAVGAPGASPAAAAAITAPVADLWPLSPRFPALAIDVVRSKLPTLTLRAVRLVSRAARDDLVDGRATRVRRLWADAPVDALVGAAPRLRSLVSLSTFSLDERFDAMQGADCAPLAAALGRLPAGGAALRELRLRPYPVKGDPGYEQQDADELRGLARLAAAVARLPALVSFEAAIFCRELNSRSPAAAALAAAGARLRQAPERLCVSFAQSAGEPAGYVSAPDLSSVLPPRPQSLRRLETLALGAEAAAVGLPALFALEAASALTRLRNLSLDLECAAEDPPAVQWHAPWLRQLTRLALIGGKAVRYASRALAPRALPALRVLEAASMGSAHEALSLTHVRALLAACDAAALQKLSLRVAGLDVQREVAAVLPALRDLELLGASFWAEPEFAPAGGAFFSDQHTPNRAHAAWRAFCELPLAQLTRLRVDAGRHVFQDGAAPAPGLAPLFAAGWARGLRALELGALRDDDGGRVLRALRGLCALTGLRTLALDIVYLDEAALDEAAAEGWADGWAPRLASFELASYSCSVRAFHALLRLPFGDRLERLRVSTQSFVSSAELDGFAIACAAVLPRLATLEFSAASR